MSIRVSKWMAIYQLAIMVNRLAASTETRKSAPGYTSVADASRYLIKEIEATIDAEVPPN